MNCFGFAANPEAGIADMLRGVDCATQGATAFAFDRLFGGHGALTLALTALLTIYIALLAFNLLTGRSALRLSLLTPRALVLGLVLTFATSWVAYQQVVWNLATGAPDEVARILIGSQGSAINLFADHLDYLFRAVTDAAAIIPNAAHTANAGASTIGVAKGSVPFTPSELLWSAALLLLLGTAGVLVVSKIALAALLAIGPVFIILALFNATRGLFEGWARAALVLSLVPLLTVLIGGEGLLLMTPLVQSLPSTSDGPTIHQAIAVFLAACIYIALLFIALKATTTITASWTLIRAENSQNVTDHRTGSRASAEALRIPISTRESIHDDRIRQLVIATQALSASAGPASRSIQGVAGASVTPLVAIRSRMRGLSNPIFPAKKMGCFMISRTALCAVLMMGAVPTLGQAMSSVQGSASEEARVRTVLYDESSIVPIMGHEGFQSAVLFSSDEKIENVAVGDSSAWQVTPNKRANVLFLKPVLASARTNMTVVTDKRVYLFDLLSAAKSGSALYSLHFTYPIAALPSIPTAAASLAPTLNFNWSAKGARKLFPSHAFDDGHTVYLAWEKSSPLPAILAVGPDGSEGPVNFTVHDDTIAIEGVPRQLVLRSGTDRATVTDLDLKTAPATPGHTAGN